MYAPVETYRGAVYAWHMDHVGHLNESLRASQVRASTRAARPA